MHRQVEEITGALRAATARLHRLRDAVPEDAWAARPAPDRWSVGECVAHLNLTSQAYLPILREGLERARARGGGAPERYRRDLLGWLIWRSSGEPARRRVRTAAPFIPQGTQTPGALVAEWERLQLALLEVVAEADGLPVHRVKIPSPFSARIRYSLYSALTILAPHQHRHLAQAEAAWAAVHGQPVDAPPA